MNLEVVLSNCTFTIELFDIPVIRSWYHEYKNRDINNYTFCFSMIRHDEISDNSRDYINSRIKEIHEAKQQLETLGYVWPKFIPLVEHNAASINQTVLNKLHRFFTNNWRWFMDNGQRKHGYPNPYDPTFVPPMDLTLEEWVKIIDRINLAVHDLEHFAVPEHTKKFILDNNLNIEVLCIKSNLSERMRFTIEEYHHNYKFNLDDDSYPVLLPNEILGKNVLLSFSDNDDPNEVDVWGRQEAQIGFYIDLNKNRRKIYNSDKFKQWADSHNRSIGSLPLEFEIGRVKNLPLPPEKFYQNDYQLLGINFV